MTHRRLSTKTRIGIQVRMIFAAVMPRKRYLLGHLVLTRKVESPRFTRIGSVSPRGHVHHFELHRLDEIDEEFEELIAESYRVGCQEHLR